MTTPAQGQPENNVGGTGEQGDKPYASYLAELPEGMRSTVEPLFQKWDGDVTRRFQSVHSEYEPYKGLIDEWDPEGLQAGVDLLIALRNDPRAFYDTLAQNFGFAEQGQTPPGNNGNGQQPPITPQQGSEPSALDLENHPMVKQLLDNQTQMAQLLQAQQMQAQQAHETEVFNQVMGALHAKYDSVVNGEVRQGFDDAYVTTLIAQGMEPEKAVEQFRGMITNYGAPAPSAPMVLGPGGGLPSNYVDPAKMSQEDRMRYITQRLAQSAAQTP